MGSTPFPDEETEAQGDCYLKSLAQEEIEPQSLLQHVLSATAHPCQGMGRGPRLAGAPRVGSELTLGPFPKKQPEPGGPPSPTWLQRLSLNSRVFEGELVTLWQALPFRSLPRRRSLECSWW